MKILGAISGSSLDGLDLALCDFEMIEDRIHWSLLKSDTIEFSDPLTESLKRATTMSAKELFKLDADFAKFSVDAIRRFLLKEPQDVAYISSHGHTIFHHPEDGFTVQIGNGGIIAALSGIPTISDCRMNDIALGGQGAPIAPIVEQYLFPEHQYHLNFGGIANISIHNDDSITSFDVCPCNQILNALSQKKGLPYDDGGQLASQGSIDFELIKMWEQLPYFLKEPPKSLDNSWVMTDFYQILLNREINVNDGLATMVEFVVGQIDKAIRQNRTPPATSMMIAGGGAHNTFLIEQLKNKIKDLSISIETPTTDIVNSKEAILMALMGFLRAQEVPNCIPSVTGASRSTIGGAIYLP